MKYDIFLQLNSLYNLFKTIYSSLYNLVCINLTLFIFLLAKKFLLN